jgi:hypothetical protein
MMGVGRTPWSAADPPVGLWHFAEIFRVSGEHLCYGLLPEETPALR